MSWFLLLVVYNLSVYVTKVKCYYLFEIVIQLMVANNNVFPFNCFVLGLHIVSLHVEISECDIQCFDVFVINNLGPQKPILK